MARDELMTRVLKVMADHQLDAIVHKSIEHQPTLIKDGVNPPYVSSKGAPDLNTFLVFVPTITVPAGFSSDQLPAGISFLGRPYDEGALIKLAYSYEQGTLDRKPPESTPPLCLSESDGVPTGFLCKGARPCALLAVATTGFVGAQPCAPTCLNQGTFGL